MFSTDGRLLPSPSTDAIQAIRQISRTFKKVFEVCAPALVDKAVNGFVSTDRLLSQVTIPKTIDAAAEIAHVTFGDIVGSAVTSPGPWKHGPGAVSEHFDSVRKYGFDAVSPQIALEVGLDQFCATWQKLELDPPRFEEVPARLIAVPKTATKPRLISIEPSYNQFIQQGIHKALKDGLARNRVCSYSSQKPNQLLALIGSRDGALCTVDLSEASDRVHMGVVRDLFRFNPTFVRMLENTRSRLVTLPDGRELILNKFASMGSALTFPIEVMVFTTLVFLTVCTVERNFSKKFIRELSLRDDIRVYGDDIIMPTQYYPTLVEILTSYGLIVNQSKSFSTGLFRESCGFDSYAGVNVTPVYARRAFPTSRGDVEELISWSAFRNQFYTVYGAGLVTDFLDRMISEIIPYPVVREGSECGGIVRIGPDYSGPIRHSSTLHRREIRCMSPSSTRKRTTADHDAILFKALYEDFNEDTDHLTHHGRPVSSKLKYRWLPA